MNTNPKPKFQACFSLNEFRHRRTRVCDAIGNDVAVIQGRSASRAMDVFRQHNDFFYLCGVEVPNAYLMINGATATTTLYLGHGDKHVAEQEGAELNCDEDLVAIQLTGVDFVKPLAALESDLREQSSVYVCHNGAEGRQACQDSINAMRKRNSNDPWVDDTTIEAKFIDLLKNRCGTVDVKNLSPIIKQLRATKSDEEISLMRRTGKLAAIATAEAIRSTQANLIESQLAAVAEYVFMVNGAVGGGYRPIVASGENIWNLHYHRNDSLLKDGDLVLFDYAPDVCNYTNDIGRMWPVSGKYQPWQRELYSLVVDYHLVLLDITKPGMTPRQIRTKAAELMSASVSRTRWSRPAFADAAQKLLATSRACTHSVGMAVHDESGYQDDDTELVPGLVFALDPQLWVPEDRLYFRVEDTVVVTDSGLENLTEAVPHSPDEIETLMQSPGLIQTGRELLV